MGVVVDCQQAMTAESETTTFQEGQMAGAEWASSYATTAQLKRLERARDSLASNHPDWASHFDEGDYIWFMGGRETWLGSLIAPHLDADVFWDRAIGDGWQDLVMDPMYLKGFCDGALDCLVN